MSTNLWRAKCRLQRKLKANCQDVWSHRDFNFEVEATTRIAAEKDAREWALQMHPGWEIESMDLFHKE